MTPELEQLLINNGYKNFREIDGMVCATLRFIFTVGVCYGLDESGCRGRFCFENQLFAELFLKEWDGITPPVVGEDGCTAIK